MLGQVAALPHVRGVTSPFTPAGAGQVSKDGTVAFATVIFDQQSQSLPKAAVQQVITTAGAAAGGPSNPFGVLAQRLRAGKIAVLVCDLDVTGGGIEVDFFGKKARMMGGSAALAVHTGAALMPVTLWFEGDDWGLHIHHEIPAPTEGNRRQKTIAMMQEVARVFEAGIRAHPQDWHMMQPVFVADIDAG